MKDAPENTFPRVDKTRRSLLFPSAFAGVALVFFRLYPVPAHPKFLLCGFHWITGKPCPLCGMTRGLSRLAKGYWVEAIHWNALSPLLFAILVGILGAGLLEWLGFEISWNFLPEKFRKGFWDRCLLLFLCYGFLRVVNLAP